MGLGVTLLNAIPQLIGFVQGIPALSLLVTRAIAPNPSDSGLLFSFTGCTCELVAASPSQPCILCATTRAVQLNRLSNASPTEEPALTSRVAQLACTH
jgi:hypothetical protein